MAKEKEDEEEEEEEAVEVVTTASTDEGLVPKIVFAVAAVRLRRPRSLCREVSYTSLTGNITNESHIL